LARAAVRSGLAVEGGVSGEASPAAVGGEEEAGRGELVPIGAQIGCGAGRG
jgi:hypothetical protein